MGNVIQLLKRVASFTDYSFSFQCENHFSPVRIRAILIAKTITTKIQEQALNPEIIVPTIKMYGIC